MPISLLSVLIAAVFAAPALAQGPIAHWTMDELVDGVVPDVTGNGHDATLGPEGAEPPAAVDGAIGKALAFDPEREHFLTVAQSQDFNFQGPFTVMAWIKPSRRNAQFEIACMKGDKSGDPPWPGWRLRYFWARAMLQVGTPDGEQPTVSSAEWSVPAEFWSHVAGSWDGMVLRVFVSGVEKAAEPFSGQIAPQHRWRPLILGNFIGRKNAYAFDGSLDDIKVFDRALSEQEVFEEAARGMAD
jgi:hypothetical protein